MQWYLNEWEKRPNKPKQKKIREQANIGQVNKEQPNKEQLNKRTNKEQPDLKGYKKDKSTWTCLFLCRFWKRQLYLIFSYLEQQLSLYFVVSALQTSDRPFFQ